jgi:hypothetical protein
MWKLCLELIHAVEASASHSDSSFHQFELGGSELNRALLNLTSVMKYLRTSPFLLYELYNLE